MIRRLALLAASFGFSLAVALAAGEAAFRMAYDLDSVSQPPDWTQYDEELGWRLRPGDYNYFDAGAFTYTRIRVNESGVRGGPLELRVPKGRRRVSVVGDSFVFAAALNEGERFTDRLAEAAGSGVDVVPLGVAGYGTGQQALFLERLATQGYEPGETVVLVFFTNDLTDNAGYEYGSFEPAAWIPAFRVTPDGSLDHTKPRPAESPSTTTTLARGSVFLQFLANRAQVVASRFPALIELGEAVAGFEFRFGRMPSVIGGWYAEGWQQEWERTSGILGWLEARVRARGARLVVLSIPSPFQVEAAFRALLERQRGRDPRFDDYFADPDRPQRLLAEWCAARGLDFVDATAALRERNSSEAVFFLREGHLNPAGAEVVGRLLAQRLFPAR